MAAPRKSAQQVAAREKAREKAAEFTARHEELIELAAKFIEHDDAAEAARQNAGRVVSQMIETGESKSAVAARLGLTPATLKKYLPTPEATGPASVPTEI